MYRSGSTALILLAVLLASTAPSMAGGNINGVLGWRIMEEDDWEPVDSPVSLGVNADFGLFAWPVNIAVGLRYSTAEDSISFSNTSADVTGTNWDLSAGVSKTWTFAETIHPYVGGGLAWVNAEKEIDPAGGSTVSDDDSSLALYVDWGLYWRLNGSFNIGLSGRFVGGTDVTLGDEEINADYFQAGLILGYGWE